VIWELLGLPIEKEENHSFLSLKDDGPGYHVLWDYFFFVQESRWLQWLMSTEKVKEKISY